MHEAVNGCCQVRTRFERVVKRSEPRVSTSVFGNNSIASRLEDGTKGRKLRGVDKDSISRMTPGTVIGCCANARITSRAAFGETFPREPIIVDQSLGPAVYYDSR